MYQAECDHYTVRSSSTKLSYDEVEPSEQMKRLHPGSRQNAEVDSGFHGSITSQVFLLVFWEQKEHNQLTAAEVDQIQNQNKVARFG